MDGFVNLVDALLEYECCFNLHHGSACVTLSVPDMSGYALAVSDEENILQDN